MLLQRPGKRRSGYQATKHQPLAMVQSNHQSEETGNTGPKVRDYIRGMVQHCSNPGFRFNKPAVFTKKTTAKGVFTKKPTGLEKKPFGPKYPPKFVNSNYQKYKNQPKLPVKKVRLAPIPDLRPTSIDRIDILRWGNDFFINCGKKIILKLLFQTSKFAKIIKAGD